jgi:hypothetical protein
VLSGSGFAGKMPQTADIAFICVNVTNNTVLSDVFYHILSLLQRLIGSLPAWRLNRMNPVNMRPVIAHNAHADHNTFSYCPVHCRTTMAKIKYNGPKTIFNPANKVSLISEVIQYL